MKIHRVIRKQIAHDQDGIQAAGELNAVVSINVNEQNAVTASEQDAPKPNRGRKRKAPKPAE